MRSFFEKLYTITPALFWLAFINGILATLSCIGIYEDPRLVGGDNPWIVPLKFEISVSVYALTIGWILQYVPIAKRRKISGTISLAMSLEIFFLNLQAARGVRAHFDLISNFDKFVFVVLSIFILLNTYMLIRLFIIYINKPPILPKPYLWSIQLGLFFLLLSSLIGAYISFQHGHTVGRNDGGPGLFFLNWSTVAGDLRVPHFVSLHAIQVLIPLGWYLSLPQRRLGENLAHKLVSLCSLFLFTVIFALLWQSIMGLPLIASTKI